MDKSVWKEAVGENAYEKTMGSCNRGEGGIYAKERESLPSVQRRERGGQRIYKGAVEEGLYLAI